MSGAAKADLVVLAVPSFAVASTAERLAKIVPPHTVISTSARAWTPSTATAGSPTIHPRTAMNGSNPVVALTGPTHAEEVATRHSDGYRSRFGEPCGG